MAASQNEGFAWLLAIIHHVYSIPGTPKQCGARMLLLFLSMCNMSSVVMQYMLGR